MNTRDQEPSLRSGGRTRLLIGIVLLATVLPLRTYVLSPRSKQLESEEARAAALLGYTENMTDSALDPPPDDLHLALSRLVQLERGLATEDGLAGLARSLEALSRNTGLNLVSIAPEPPISDGPYTRHPFSLTARGDYHSIVRFAAAVAELPIVAIPTVLTIGSGPPAPRDALAVPAHATTPADGDNRGTTGALTTTLRVDAFALSPGFDPVTLPKSAGSVDEGTIRRHDPFDYPTIDGPEPFLTEDVFQGSGPSLEDLHLTGVLVSPDRVRSVAIFSIANPGDWDHMPPGGLYRLHVGEAAGGVTVMSIDIDSVAVAVREPFGTTLHSIPVRRSTNISPNKRLREARSWEEPTSHRQ